MIGPVSNTGRAMMASLQQAINKGMPLIKPFSTLRVWLRRAWLLLQTCTP